MAQVLEQLRREAVLATRRLVATPIFTVFAIVSLALGVGVTTATYSVIASVLWAPLGLPHPDRLIALTPANRNDWRTAVSWPDFSDLRAGWRASDGLSAAARFDQVLATPASSDVVVGAAVSGNYFGMLGVSVARGRALAPADDRPDADAVLVLANAFWRAKLGADASIVGRTVRLGGQPFVVVGVAAESFHGIDPPSYGFDPEAWIPLAVAPRLPGLLRTLTDPTQRDRQMLSVLARLPADRSVAAIAGEFARVGARLDREAPIMERPAPDRPLVPVARAWSAQTITSLDAMPTRVPVGALAVSLVGLVLVVACTNLANLMLGRGAARRHELAVRRALGASRWRLVREQAAESALIALGGGVLSLGVARVMLNAFTMGLSPARGRIWLLVPELNLPALLIAAGSVVLSLVVFGLGPAMQMTRPAAGARLSGDAGGLAPVRWRTRRQLICWQVAISTAFFLIAAVCVRAVAREVRHDSGIDLPHLALGSVSFRIQHWDEARARVAIEAIESLARGAKGFQATALTSSMPYGLKTTLAEVAPADRPFPDHREVTQPWLLTATPGIFRTLGVPILKGRAFDERDVQGTTPVIVLSEHTAKDLFGTTDVVGRRLQFRGGMNASDEDTIETRDIIGVARDTDTHALFERQLGMVYVPLAQRYEPSLILVGRTAGNPTTLVGTLEAIVRHADPDLAISSTATGPTMLTGAYELIRPVAALFAGLAALALLLAMTGLYGVLSQVVARRTREMGLRVALGAEAGAIGRQVVGDGLRPVIQGLVLGLGFGVLGRLLVRATWAGADASPVDPSAFSLAAVVLVLSALAACYLPARRASRVDPNVALKEL